MRKIILFIIGLYIIFPTEGQTPGVFSSLFNEKDLTGWVMPGSPPGFKAENGIMIAVPSKGSDIFSEKEYGNFVLRFDYLLSEVGNSGVLIRCDAANPWKTGVEVQLLAPWTPYRDDLHCTGSIYGHVAVTDRPDETTGKWHEMEIVCDRKIITVSVDGQVATRANIDSVESMQDKHLQGVLGFQSNHSKKGEFAHFRNLSIWNLDADPGYLGAGFYDNDARVRTQAWKAAKEMGAPMIDNLIMMLSGDNVKAQAGARQVLFDIVAKATAPDSSGSDKEKIINDLKAATDAECSKAALSYIDWLIGFCSAGN